MDILFLCTVGFLFLLAIFDLSVGVSNDAVNFLNSAIGSRAASFKRIRLVASVGVFIGAAMCNGIQAAKEAADYITQRDNNHDGIEEVIRKFML